MNNIKEDIEKILIRNDVDVCDGLYGEIKKELVDELETYINKVREEDLRSLKVISDITDTNAKFCNGYNSANYAWRISIEQKLQSIKEQEK